jgi:hypothetical protein
MPFFISLFVRCFFPLLRLFGFDPAIAVFAPLFFAGNLSPVFPSPIFLMGIGMRLSIQKTGVPVRCCSAYERCGTEARWMAEC